MKRKLVICALIASMALAAVGCGDGGSVSENNTDAAACAPAEGKSEFTADDLAVTYNDVTIKAGDDISVLDSLGEPTSYSENPGDGNEIYKNYTYGDDDLLIAAKGSKDGDFKIDSINILGDKPKFMNGIKFGATSEAVLTALGEPDSKDEYECGGSKQATYSYNSKETQLNISFDNNKVNGISIYPNK
ncbi:MAG: hypothetical protein K5769_07960 [Pseudobutyrivibrio sp.]|nr:hypothetical protein [Pseudobutyrivibrio sp.]